MKPLFCIVVICCLGFVAPQSHSSPHRRKPAKFLLVLLDGFRWNYFNQENLTNFARFFEQGVHAEYMQPIFPSLSYPGYYSILTGLYAENHGFIENTMYDPKHDMLFWTDTDENGTHPFWWEESEPIWTTAAKANRKTFVYLWPGCHVRIHNTLPTYFEKYEFVNDTSLLKRNVADAIEQLSKDEADVSIVYTEYTDIIGHKYGPESNEMKSAVRNVDAVIGQLFKHLKNRSMEEKVNVIIVSDHGMTKSDVASSKRLKVSDAVHMSDIKFLLGYGAEVGIHPVEGKLDEVYSQLQNLNGIHVWKKEEIPENLRYRNNQRVPPIQVVAKEGFFIEPEINTTKQVPPFMTKVPMEYKGFHGYIPADMEDMRAIFLAMGPDFQKNIKHGPIQMTDVYNLMVHVLDLKGHPNNGTWSSVKEMLANGESSYKNGFAQKVYMVFVTGFILLVHFALSFLMY